MMDTAVLGWGQILKIRHTESGQGEILDDLTSSRSPPDYQREELFSNV